VISDRFWRVHFGRNLAALGSKLEINGTMATIVGVTPPEFFGETLKADPAEVWLPLAADRYMNPARPLLDARDSHWLYIMGRLKPGVSRAQAGTLLTAHLQRWLSEEAGATSNPEARRAIAKSYVEVTPGGSGISQLRRRYSDSLHLLEALAGAVLLIACANLANLLMARGSARVRETSVRLALGASRTRLLRQSLTESGVIAIAGGAAGVGLAMLAQQPLVALAFRGAEFVPISTAPDLTVLGFALGISLLTGLVFGIAPAWMMAKGDVTPALRAQGATAGAAGSFGLKKLLVSAQVALSVVLLVSAGLLGRSLVNLEQQRLGFAREQVLLFKVDPQLSGYRADQVAELFPRIAERVRAVPQVSEVSYALYAPFGGHWSSGISIAGRVASRKDGTENAMWDRVGPGHFRVLGTQLIAGRAIDQQDLPNSRRVAVVNQTFGRKYLGPNPLGRRFGFGNAAHGGDIEIVGVLEDAKYWSPRDDAEPMFFLPLGQIAPGDHDYDLSAQIRSNFLQDIEVRVAGDAGAVAPAIRRAIADAAPNLTILRVAPLAQQIGAQFNQERLIARLTAAFGLLALALASVGLYGVLAFSVERRTSEIGLRMALGATGGRVARSILRESLVQTIAGIAIGVPAALAATRLITASLFGLHAADPVTMAAVVAALLACTLVAAYLPARRASRVEPLVALRNE
jgi:predicted permease